MTNLEAATALPELLAEIERLTAERDEAQIAAAYFPEGKLHRIIKDWKSRALTAEAEIERLRGALEGFTEFAWTAVDADCQEARDNLIGIISRARQALSSRRVEGVKP